MSKQLTLSLFKAMSASLEGLKDLQAADIETLYMNQRLTKLTRIKLTQTDYPFASIDNNNQYRLWILIINDNLRLIKITQTHFPVASICLVPPGMMRWLPIKRTIPS